MTPAVVCVLAFAAAAPIPKAPVAKTPAELLVGTWELVKSSDPPPPGLAATLEFTADGVMNITVTKDGKPSEKSRSGKYKLEDGRLKVEFDGPQGPRPDDTMAVKDVTADKLILVERMKNTLELKRIAPKPAK